MKFFSIIALLITLAPGAHADNLCEEMTRHLLTETLGVLAPAARAVNDPKLWELQWHDEFDVPGALDASKWKFEIGGTGWGNREAQYYTDRLENARVENGNLVIEARKENFENKKYTSARINSVARMTYGKIEFRAKLPRGRGTWGAAWLLAAQTVHGTRLWPDNGEIDVMEAVGNENNLNHFSVHSAANNFMNHTQYTYLEQIPNADYDFHVYSVEWLPNSISFFTDGTLNYTVQRNESDDWKRWPFNQDMGIILNLAIGGSWGAERSPIDDSMFPTRLEFDYVRVYRPTAENPGCRP